ncbi:C-5 cytosine-specific DNA methylase [Nostoc commune NIES-4072]|uniref:C-5 cytosine-specific DNA methylase n=1 Tax=Nostoc commune NIES-4072 TaxID=2005467 RepID=A0A2R5FX17_NOSCO|nr:hypothetical protein [Nostoc commune]BBD70605.1 C-5 cytosine-specific DNA methylase [Nostoc commune HK-02]GBG23260.1 C-5 cytosine-specific DNA methylase [Nostoc commune NIES-4072]
MTKGVIVELSAIPEKSSEKGVKGSQCESVGCLYPYLETKKLLDGSTFIKKAKSKKTSPKLDVCKNFDNTKIKPTLPDNAPIAQLILLFSGYYEAYQLPYHLHLKYLQLD